MIRKLWCKLAHGRDIAFAGGSTYRCNRCLLEFPVPWAKQPKASEAPEGVAIGVGQQC